MTLPLGPLLWLLVIAAVFWMARPCRVCSGHGTQDADDGRERVCGGCGGGG